MLLRALMLNPLPVLSGPVKATYYSPANLGALMDVTWDAVSLTLTFASTGLSRDGMWGVSGTQVTGLPSKTSGFERYPVAGTGLVRPAIDTYPNPAAPSGTSFVAGLPNGDFIFSVPANQGYRYRVINAITGVTAGPFTGLDTSGIVDGDAFYAGATVNGTGPASSPFGYAQDPNTRVNYLATALIQNTEVDFVATVGSGGKATGPLTGLPFRWGDGPALVRAYRTTLLGSAPSRQASGSVRLAGEVRLYEFHDDGDAGFKMSDGRALHNVRKSERRVLGWFYLSGGKATFVGALLAGETYFSGLAAMVDGNPARWVQASGRWFASDETRVQDSGMSVRVLTSKGVIASDGASVVYADASQAVTRSPPSVVALNANMSWAYSIPALDAVVVPVDTQFSNYGMAYVTFDAGATWKGPVKTMTSSGGSSPQLNVVMNPKLVPLYPTAS